MEKEASPLPLSFLKGGGGRSPALLMKGEKGAPPPLVVKLKGGLHSLSTPSKFKEKGAPPPRLLERREGGPLFSERGKVAPSPYS